MTDEDLRDLADRYRNLTDDALTEAAREYAELVEPAQAVLLAELERRSLSVPQPAKPKSYAEMMIPMLSNAALRLMAKEHVRLAAPIRAALRAEMERRGLPMPPSRIPKTYAEMTIPELKKAAVLYTQLGPASQQQLRDAYARQAMALPDLNEEAGETKSSEPDAKVDWVTVARYRDLSEAIVTRSVLEQAGISCFLRDENVVRLDWGWSNMIGGMRLDVPAEDAADALKLLHEPMPASFPVDCGPDYQQPVCPRCGSLSVSEDNTGQKWNAAAALAAPLTIPVALVGIPFYRHDAWKCDLCGTRWIDDGQPPS